MYLAILGASKLDLAMRIGNAPFRMSKIVPISVRNGLIK